LITSGAPDASEDNVFHCNSVPSSCASPASRDSKESVEQSAENIKQYGSNENGISAMSEERKSDSISENNFLMRQEKNLPDQSSREQPSNSYQNCQQRFKNTVVPYRKLIVDSVDMLQLNENNRWWIFLILVITLAFLLTSGFLRLTNSSSVTILALTGLCMGVVEFYWSHICNVLSTIHLRPARDWSLTDEQHFDHFCSVTALIWTNFTEAVTELQVFRQNKSKLAYATVVLSLLMLALLSTKLDGLFLIYSLFAAVCVVLGCKGQERIKNNN